MAMDNAKFEQLSKNFPSSLKFRLNPVYYGARVGIQAYLGLLVGGSLLIYLNTFNGITFPYLYKKQKVEYSAVPDFYSKQVLLYQRTVPNTVTQL
ncbi:unnamed protein product (macronuclear) [Paramecium tetraurelia]|uniref:Uncharacterized protein n=1 Tax=Paramecium tetraurelia TaxID=5888 RepID=A0EGX9_PARTE|nr:uncharacterized protein GSPATT00026894001 [Paramecium tetraurelia]CAK94570.1 unnamed protein product [Paramecium tetraurelia]|eukprot:XP_001461943.1 hypothetical protein (macronuclear) [Paramecium tetraurelia strain d4-2]